jgi:uncharacterized protein with HEPN domain
MTRRTIYRLNDIKEAISNIRRLLDGKSFDQMYADPDVRAAFERYLEIASEASRHIPDDLKNRHGHGIPWRNVADLGNVLRHTYHKSDARALWEIYTTELDALDASVDAMINAVSGRD